MARGKDTISAKFSLALRADDKKMLLFDDKIAAVKR